MAEDAWIRTYFDPGDPALVHFVVFGASSERLALSRSTHRVRGVPAAAKVGVVRAGDAAFVDLRAVLPPSMAEAELLEAAAACSQQTLVRAELEDAPELLELRDLIGLVTALSECEGAVAVLDTQTMTLRTPAAWRREVFAPDEPAAAVHVAFLASQEPDGLWLHTRGLRKFGRPDLSMRGLAEDEMEGAANLLERFASYFIAGGHLEEGREVQVKGWPPGWRCHLAGDPDDPEYNNVHVEIVRPTD